MMKIMTCKQLGGACNKKFHASTFEEMAELSKNHGTKMNKKGDEAHIAAMNEMQGMMKSPEARANGLKIKDRNLKHYLKKKAERLSPWPISFPSIKRPQKSLLQFFSQLRQALHLCMIISRIPPTILNRLISIPGKQEVRNLFLSESGSIYKSGRAVVIPEINICSPF